MRVLIAPAVEQDLRGAGCSWLVAVGHRYKHQIRRRPHPHASKADLNPADQIQSLNEDGALVELPVAIGILKNQDAVLTLALLRAYRIGIGFRNPESAAMIDGESNRLLHIWFPREQSRLEPGRQDHLPDGSFGREAGEFNGVRWRHCFIRGSEDAFSKTKGNANAGQCDEA